MLQLGPRQEPLGSPPPEPAARPQPAPGDQQPTRFLLIRQKPGDLPWLVRALMRYMAPVKAALDSSLAFLAKSFSRFSRVRFNAVSPGLLKTSASAGIPGYVDSYLYA